MLGNAAHKFNGNQSGRTTNSTQKKIDQQTSTKTQTKQKKEFRKVSEFLNTTESAKLLAEAGSDFYDKLCVPNKPLGVRTTNVSGAKVGYKFIKRRKDLVNFATTIRQKKVLSVEGSQLTILNNGGAKKTGKLVESKYSVPLFYKSFKPKGIWKRRHCHFLFQETNTKNISYYKTEVVPTFTVNIKGEKIEFGSKSISFIALLKKLHNHYSKGRFNSADTLRKGLLIHGRKGTGSVVAHKCGNGGAMYCCNRRHLMIATRQGNEDHKKYHGFLNDHKTALESEEQYIKDRDSLIEHWETTNLFHSKQNNTDKLF